VGYRLYRADKLTNVKSHGQGREHRVIGAFCGVVVYADTVENYVNETFYYALQAWQLTKMWGMGNGSLGWGNEPIDYIDAITALESEQNALENEEMEKSTSKGKMQNAKSARAGKVSDTI
jgi:hypothetical protein